MMIIYTWLELLTPLLVLLLLLRVSNTVLVLLLSTVS